MLKKAPLIRVLIPLIFGIILGIYFPFHHWFIFAFTVFLFLLTALLLFIKKTDVDYRIQPFFGILFSLFFISAGYSITLIKTDAFKSSHFSLSNAGTAYGEISEPLSFKGNTAKAVISVRAINDKQQWISSSGKALLYFQKDSLVMQLKTGDRIIFTPDFKTIKGPQNPSEFDYKQYLAFHLIYKQAYLKSGTWQKIEGASPVLLKRVAEELRNKLLDVIHSNIIQGNEAAVLSALIIGFKDKLDASVIRAYSSSGAMHVLAVSGLHVGIIYMIINSLFFFFDRIKHGTIIKTIIVLLMLWMYALITGLSPSVLRASTMFSFVAIGNTYKRKTNIYNTLAASAIFLLLINPYMITEVGFQLSYFAVIGIVAFQKGFYDLLEVKNKWLDKVWQLTCVSIAAQISTFPLGLLYFHQFPNYFLLSNLVVIPLATLIIHSGILMFALSPFPMLCKYSAICTEYLIKALNKSVFYFEQLPFAITEGISISVLETITIYLLILLISLYISQKHKPYLYGSLATFILLLLYNVYEHKTHKEQKAFVVYNIPGVAAFNYIDGKENILFTDLKLLNDQNKMTFHLKNNWIKSGLEKEKVVSVNSLSKEINLSVLFTINNTRLFVKRNFIAFYDKKMVLLNNTDMLSFLPEKKVDCHYVILSNNIKVKISDIVKRFNFNTIIIDSSNSQYLNRKWINEAAAMGINVYSVPERGAFVENLSR
jgi:competence protein ComEC